jgi:hypothetical protein
MREGLSKVIATEGYGGYVLHSVLL